MSLGAKHCLGIHTHSRDICLATTGCRQTVSSPITHQTSSGVHFRAQHIRRTAYGTEGGGDNLHKTVCQKHIHLPQGHPSEVMACFTRFHPTVFMFMFICPHRPTQLGGSSTLFHNGQQYGDRCQQLCPYARPSIMHANGLHQCLRVGSSSPASFSTPGAQCILGFLGEEG